MQTNEKTVTEEQWNEFARLLKLPADEFFDGLLSFSEVIVNEIEKTTGDPKKGFIFSTHDHDIMFVKGEQGVITYGHISLDDWKAFGDRLELDPSDVFRGVLELFSLIVKRQYAMDGVEESTQATIDGNTYTVVFQQNKANEDESIH